MSNKYGYSRCSTNDVKQDIDRQRKELMALGVPKENIFHEYESGFKDDRVEFHRLMGIIQEGDIIYSTELSRLTRSTKYLMNILEIALEKKIKIVAGTFTIDCTNDLDPMTRCMATIIGAFSQLEAELTRQRIMSGLENARAKGKVFGRPKVTYKTIPANVKKFYPMYQSKELNKVEYAKVCGITRPTLDKYLKILDEHEKKSKK